MPTPSVDVSGIVDATITAASKWTTPFNNLKTFIADMTAGNVGAPVERLLWGTQSASIVGTTLSLITKKYVIVDTDGSAAQNLATITGPVQGHEVVLEMANAGRVVTVKHGVGNIFLWGGADVVLSAGKVLHLFRTSTGWSDTFIPVVAPPVPGMLINTARTVLGSNAASVTIGSIPATFQHLMLVLELRTDVAAGFESILLRFNGDSTAASYYTQYIAAAGAATAAAEILGATSTGILLFNAAVGNTGSAGNGHCVITIKNYASTTMRRTITFHTYSHSGNTTGLLKLVVGGGDWTNAAAAISSIAFLPNAGTNIVTGSAYTLYGYN